MIALVVLIAIASFSFAFGWFVVGPLILGHKPFTTPAQAARGERKLRR